MAANLVLAGLCAVDGDHRIGRGLAPIGQGRGLAACGLEQADGAVRQVELRLPDIEEVLPQEALGPRTKIGARGHELRVPEGVVQHRELVGDLEPGLHVPIHPPDREAAVSHGLRPQLQPRRFVSVQHAEERPGVRDQPHRLTVDRAADDRIEAVHADGQLAERQELAGLRRAGWRCCAEREQHDEGDEMACSTHGGGLSPKLSCWKAQAPNKPES